MDAARHVRAGAPSRAGVRTVPDQDRDCFLLRPRPAQVRTIEFHAREARGLGWARAKAQSLWQGEEYSLQIDIHMRFADDWDEQMFDLLSACDAPDPVLTVYSPGCRPPGQRRTESRSGRTPRGLAEGKSPDTPDGNDAVEIGASDGRLPAGIHRSRGLRSMAAAFGTPRSEQSARFAAAVSHSVPAGNNPAAVVVAASRSLGRRATKPDPMQEFSRIDAATLLRRRSRIIGLGLLRAAGLGQQQADHRWDDGDFRQDIAPALGMLGKDVVFIVFIVGHVALLDPVRTTTSWQNPHS
jgi:hypothetical protein